MLVAREDADPAPVLANRVPMRTAMIPITARMDIVFAATAA